MLLGYDKAKKVPLLISPENDLVLGIFLTILFKFSWPFMFLIFWVFQSFQFWGFMTKTSASLVYFILYPFCQNKKGITLSSLASRGKPWRIPFLIANKYPEHSKNFSLSESFFLTLSIPSNN